jgi:hypothetical protein
MVSATATSLLSGEIFMGKFNADAKVRSPLRKERILPAGDVVK